MVRGVGFEPTKAYATGSLLKPDLKSSTASSERSCPFDLNPAYRTGSHKVSGTPAFDHIKDCSFLKPIQQAPSQCATRPEYLIDTPLFPGLGYNLYKSSMCYRPSRGRAWRKDVSERDCSEVRYTRVRQSPHDHRGHRYRLLLVLAR